MTREEALQVIACMALEKRMSVSDGIEYDIEALDMAIEALKAQPCEDCVSRESVIDTLKLLRNKGFSVYAYDKWIEGLPSVQPEREKGEWLHFKHKGQSKIRCRNCLYEEPENIIYVREYCPCCGADMRGGE